MAAGFAADASYVREIEGSRDRIGSVRGLTVAPDGTLYVLDGVYSDPRGRGGLIWALAPGGTLTDLGTITLERVTTADDGSTTSSTEGLLSPKDITVDSQGNLYVTDRGFREVWRISLTDGLQTSLFWRPPLDDDERVMPTGITYVPEQDALIITDSEVNTVYRLPITGGAAEILYRYSEANNPPGFGGVTLTPDGTLYIAALDQNGIVRLENGAIQYIVGLLRGASDVAATADGRLIATNFDSTALVVPGVNPQLPFALDEVRFTAAD
jgi:DNA-binding beta-propeller fold protein YncE